jgi:hypothetical protein
MTLAKRRVYALARVSGALAAEAAPFVSHTMRLLFLRMNLKLMQAHQLSEGCLAEQCQLSPLRLLALYLLLEPHQLPRVSSCLGQQLVTLSQLSACLSQASRRPRASALDLEQHRHQFLARPSERRQLLLRALGSVRRWGRLAMLTGTNQWVWMVQPCPAIHLRSAP